MDAPDDLDCDPQTMFEAMTAGNPNLPVPLFLSFQQVKSKAKQYSHDIFAAQSTLVNILDRHEETVIKRWHKKATVQRQKVLTIAFPAIPPTHRPDFWAIRRETAPQRRAGTFYRDHWLLPSLNLEDLSKPRNLLLFLRSRARNPPGEFVNADANSVHVGHTAQAIMSPYLSGYTMLLAGQDTQQSYGRMLSWDDDDDAFDMMSTGIGLQPGEGLQVMEIQRRKMQFLQRCIEHILQDLPLDDLSIPKQPEPPEERLQVNSPGWPSLTQEIEEAPYRLQYALEIDRLRTFVIARRNEAEDHIWSLREDPSYFQEVALEWSDHRQERILTASGKSHPVLRQDLFWERVLSNVVVDAYTNLVAWDLVSKELDHTSFTKSNHHDQDKQGQKLPEECAEALAHFEHLINQLTKGPLGDWKVAMVASPPLRQHYVREPQDPTNTRIGVTSKDRSHKKADHLLWLLEVLLDEHQLFLCGLDNVCDELEREIRSNRTSRERISPYLASLISDLSLFGELKCHIALVTPGPRMTVVVEQKELNAKFNKKIKLFSQTFTTLTGLGKGLAKVGTPQSKFDHPTYKRRTQATTEKLQQAEKNLDIFWRHVDDHCKEKTSGTVHQMLSEILKERQLQRTPDWVEPAKEFNNNREQKESDTISSELAALELQSRSENTITAAISHARARQKTKTRGIPSTSSSTMVGGDEDALVDDVATPIFEVSKRGFKVFTSLFFTPAEGEPPGEVPWSDFLSAMASVGFSIKKLDGSAWIFAPVDDEWQQSIIFHEPHPSSKISFQVARRIGRRLWRRYGWTSENFRRA